MAEREEEQQYVASALFVYAPDAEPFLEDLRENPFGTAISARPLAEFLSDPEGCVHNFPHLVIAAPLDDLKTVLKLAIVRDLSVGFLPMKGQTRLPTYLDLPVNTATGIELALRVPEHAIDITTCNDEIMLFNAVIGWLPALDAPEDLNRWGILKRIFSRSSRLRLYPYRLTTANDRTVDTAATGAMIVQRHEGDLASRLLGKETSVINGKVSLLVASPFSLTEYVKLLWQLLARATGTGLPPALGLMESRSFQIDTAKAREVTIDGDTTIETPVTVSVQPAALRANVGEALLQGGRGDGPEKEVVRVDNLRTSKELSRSIDHEVPFFSYASEERFRDLFTALQEDARTNTTYVVFMLLSTLIATLGMFLNSSAVIIGAMILAPLMSPLVSASMALLRNNQRMLSQSLSKILLGVLLALMASALASAAFPHSPVTTEMLGRVSPGLPDLFVAILSGIAAAYARSFREIAQNLAGVAIAVALVPPLAVAGIGLGRGDFLFFLQAFLLFFTNLVGIILAATLTFRVLGFSASLQSRRGFGFVLGLLLIVAIPLGLTTTQISARWEVEKRLEGNALTINDKEVQITQVRVKPDGTLYTRVLVRTPLDAEDFAALKRAVEANVDDGVELELDIRYRL